MLLWGFGRMCGFVMAVYRRRKNRKLNEEAKKTKKIKSDGRELGHIGQHWRGWVPH